MTDWTPDTAFIRRCASDDGYNGELASSREFDRWLQSVKETAWAEGWNGARIHVVSRSENPYKSKRP